MKNKRTKVRSRSLSSKHENIFSHVSENSVVGGWSGIQKSASRTLSATSYLQEVKKILKSRTLPCGTKAFHEFMKLLIQLRSSKESGNREMAITEQLIGLLEGYPLLILNLTIFLPDGYQIEIQRDAVIVKFYVSEENVRVVDTGHLRSIDESPRSAWVWMGKSLAHSESPFRDNKKLSPRKSRTMSASLVNGNLPLIFSKSDDVNRKSPRLVSQSFSDVALRRGDVSKQKISANLDCELSNRSEVYLLEENATSTDTKTLKYINKIKTLYAKHPEVYKRFMEVLRDLHSGILESKCAISEIVSLFKSCPSLIFGFNDFLPAGSRIILHHNIGSCENRGTIAPQYIFEHFDSSRQCVEQEIIL